MRSKLPPHQRKHLEDLMASRDELKASVSEQKALNETLMETMVEQAIVLTPQNIFSLQITPNTQNIPPLSEQSPPQNILPLSEQSPTQDNSTPPPLEQSPSQINPPPRGELGTEQKRAEQPYVLGRPRKPLMRTSSRCSKPRIYLSCFRQGNRRRQRNP
jgi:hypothetical protein